VCFFCGCNVTFTSDRSRPKSYTDVLLQEMDMVAPMLRQDRRVVQLHWGGGTPTFFSPAQLESLFDAITGRFRFADDAELGIEIDPRELTPEHFDVLARCRFNRLSMGVQDFDPEVQELVNRVQPFEMTKALVDASRELGYESLNLDLIYGLPGQKLAGFSRSVEQVLTLRPDRIAMYSYAHVPWLKKPQRVLAAHLPEGTEKFAIFVSGIEKFSEAGYVYIGMDHFALPHDEIARAQAERTLWRNFQGYTTHAGVDLYALGVSAIAQIDDCYVQNTKDYAAYHAACAEGRPSTIKGWRLTSEDHLRRTVITNLLCHCVIDKREIARQFGLASFDETFAREVAALPAFVADGLVEPRTDEVRVTPLGRIFIRNVAMLFDPYLLRRPADQPKVFSRTL